MFRIIALLVIAMSMVLHPGVRAMAAEYKDTAVLLGKLKENRRSLEEGAKQAAQEEGYVISAKFEMDGDELSLSVYTAKDGKGKDAEHNTLIELSGDPTKDKWTPKKEVFADKEHIARASMQLTLMQLSRLSLGDVIRKAGETQPGTVYSANPGVANGRPVVDVLVATKDNKSVHLAVDLLTGKVSR